MPAMTAQLLAIAVCRRRDRPDTFDVGSQQEGCPALVVCDGSRPVPLTAIELCLGRDDRPQGFLPLRFQPASDESIIAIDGAVAALGSLRLVASPFHLLFPLRQERVVISGEMARYLQGR